MSRVSDQLSGLAGLVALLFRPGSDQQESRSAAAGPAVHSGQRGLAEPAGQGRGASAERAGRDRGRGSVYEPARRVQRARSHRDRAGGGEDGLPVQGSGAVRATAADEAAAAAAADLSGLHPLRVQGGGLPEGLAAPESGAEQAGAAGNVLVLLLLGVRAAPHVRLPPRRHPFPRQQQRIGGIFGARGEVSRQGALLEDELRRRAGASPLVHAHPPLDARQKATTAVLLRGLPRGDPGLLRLAAPLRGVLRGRSQVEGVDFGGPRAGAGGEPSVRDPSRRSEELPSSV